MERSALGRRELEALGAFEEIAEMDRVSKSPRKSPSRSPRKSLSKSLIKTPRSSSKSPIGSLDKLTRSSLCRELNSKPLLEQLNLETFWEDLERAKEILSEQSYAVRNINRIQGDINKVLNLLKTPIDEYCLSDITHKKIEPLKTPSIDDELKTKIKKIPLRQFSYYLIATNLTVKYLSEKYKHKNICFYNPKNTSTDSNNLKININFEKGKENEATADINYDNEQNFINFLTNCKKRYIVGLYLIEINEKTTAFSHANAFFYDKKTGLFQLMEPYGYLSRLQDLPSEYIYKLIDEQMRRILPKPYSWKTVNVDFQDAEEYGIKRERAFIDPVGYCIYWSTWFLEQKLKFLDVDIETILKETKPTLGDLRRFIRGYALFFNNIYYDYNSLINNLNEIIYSAKMHAKTENINPINFDKIQDSFLLVIIKIYLLIYLD
jgi:hypothetical protein